MWRFTIAILSAGLALAARPQLRATLLNWHGEVVFGPTNRRVVNRERGSEKALPHLKGEGRKTQ